jgi:hypothetical protein
MIVEEEKTTTTTVLGQQLNCFPFHEELKQTSTVIKSSETSTSAAAELTSTSYKAGKQHQ